MAGYCTAVDSRTTATQRRGYFLAGVGLATGEALDDNAAELNELLARANGAIIFDDAKEAIAAVTAFAKKVFAIAPFAPDDLPDDWPAILKAWLEGRALAPLASGREDEVLKFVEQTLVYKLPWAMEAVRVRGLAHGDVLEGGFSMEDVELGVAVGAVETGTLNVSAAMLMHAGFSSRLAAISAVLQTQADFTTMAELRAWLRDDAVASGRNDPDWPTTASHGLWLQFIESLAPERRRTWASTTHELDVEWDDVGPPVGTALRFVEAGDETLVYAADFTRLGRLKEPLNTGRQGLALASVGWLGDTVEVRYLGPGDLTRR